MLFYSKEQEKELHIATFKHKEKEWTQSFKFHPPTFIFPITLTPQLLMCSLDSDRKLTINYERDYHLYRRSEIPEADA